MATSKIIGKVYETTNYGMFKYILGNRDVKAKGKKYNLLKKSIQERGQIVPAIINSKFEIVDGQHRLEICKELGIPFKYIFEDEASFDDVAPTQESTRWKIMDYVKGYAITNGENATSYQYLMALSNEFSPRIPITSILKLLNSLGNEDSNKLKSGEFVITEKQYNRIAKCLRELEMLGYVTWIKENRRPAFAYWKAVSYAWRHKDCDCKRLIRLMWQNEKRIPSTSKITEYLEVLTMIYNKGLKVDNKVYLDKDWEQRLYRTW